MRQVGERVRIKQYLVVGANYTMANGHMERFVSKMVPYLGHEATVSYANRDGYQLDVDRGNYFWTDEMLEDAE